MVAILTKLVSDQRIFQITSTDLVPDMHKIARIELKQIILGVVKLCNFNPTTSEEIDTNFFTNCIQQADVFPSQLKNVLGRIIKILDTQSGSELKCK